MTGRAHAMHWMVLAGWMLITPPAPLGTALPPESEWKELAKFKTSKECDDKRDALRERARLVVTRGANAHALEVAAALGQLESRCVESTEPEPAAEAPEPAAEAAPAAPPADGAPVDEPAKD